jgi:hypothetical protein
MNAENEISPLLRRMIDDGDKLLAKWVAYIESMEARESAPSSAVKAVINKLRDMAMVIEPPALAAPSAPLVAVSHTMPELPKASTIASVRGPQGSEYRNLSMDYEPDCAMFSPVQMKDYALQCLAGQVAPQATVELLDHHASLIAGSMLGQPNRDDFHDVRDLLQDFARALLATPPTSKATEPAYKAAFDDAMLRGTGMLKMSADGVEHIPFDEFMLPVSTSKADTGEAIRNDVLEEAALLCMDEASSFDNEHNRQLGVVADMMDIAIDCADKIRALKSATPSIIKADHINDAVEMVKPTGEQL